MMIVMMMGCACRGGGGGGGKTFGAGFAWDFGFGAAGCC